MTDKEIYDLMAECDQNLSSGDVNSFGSYDEGGPRPYIGKED